jgi:outer membrane receptor protein involved in Fe transport
MRGQPKSSAGEPSSFESRPQDRSRGPAWALRATLCAGLVTLFPLLLAGPGTAAERTLRARSDDQPATVYEGRELAEVLRELQSEGLAVVFTSELVRPGMTVAAEPAAEDPRGLLEEVLAPHGLTVREGQDGVLVVVAAPDAERSPDGPGAEPVLTRPYLHDEIVVQPSRLWLLHDRSDASFSWSREEIESLPHLGGDVLRTVSLLPGTAANDVTAQFSVHGGRRDEVRIQLDGQELYDAFHLEDYDNALSIVPATVLGSATLTTGAFPASQGDRMSGVLDLRTVEPPAGRRYTLGLSVLDLLASASGQFAEDRGAWLATARRGSLDLAGEAIGDENPSFWDVLGKAELATPVGLVTAHALMATDELELDRVEEEGFERLENDYRRSYGWVTHQAAPGDRVLVETAASWAEIRRDRGSETSEEEGSFFLRDRRDLEVLGLTQTWTLELAPRHLIQAGFEARSYDASFDYTREQDPELVVIAPFAPPRETGVRFDEVLRGEHYGTWASDRFTVRERLTAELGLRYDHHTATGDDLLSPRVNLAWRLGERSVLRAAWGRFFQSQRPYELEVEDGETALHRAERSEHWVLGYEALLPENALGLEAVRAELFRREIEDPRPRYENLLEPLNFFQEVEPDRVRIAPEGSRTDGVELLVRGHRGERFDWWLAYSWARAEDRFPAALPGAAETVPRPLDQLHTVALDLNFRLPREWNLNLAWRFHSGWPTTPVEARFVSDPDDPEAEPELAAVFGPLRSERLPDDHRLDLRASRSWQTARGRWTLFFDVQNVYDRQNLAGFDLAVDEDEGTVELEEEHWPGLFPSVGFLWEF